MTSSPVFGDMPLAANVCWEIPSRNQSSRAESDLGFTLPPLLVRLYTEIANGGFGPGHGLLGLVDPCENDDQTIVGLYRESLAEHENPDVEYEFKKGVIFFCNWGCAIYTCVDCNSLDAQLVTYDSKLTWTHWTLESWLNDWVHGVDIHAQMFEAGESRMGINPFTKKPIEFKAHGKAKF